MTTHEEYEDMLRRVAEYEATRFDAWKGKLRAVLEEADVPAARDLATKLSRVVGFERVVDSNRAYVDATAQTVAALSDGRR